MNKLLSLVTGPGAAVRILVGIGGILAIILIASTLLVRTVNHTSETGRKAGVTEERAAIQTEVIKNVETAHETATQIDKQAAAGTGPELHAQCLRSARDASKCQRFLPR